MKESKDEIIRVNHAGEYGANRIYQGQLAVLKNSKSYSLIKQMQGQEEKHLKYFEKQLSENQTRPSILSPLWNIGGYALGTLTALMGEKAAMACTEAVEEVIAEHYQNQIDNLEDGELKDKIIEFRNDELEHHHTAVNSGAGDAFLYEIMTKTIKIGCKISIWLAKKF